MATNESKADGDAGLENARRGLTDAARRLAAKCKGDVHLTKPLTYLLGALYSVRMAQRLGFPDRKSGRSENDPTDLAALAKELVDGTHLRNTGRWHQGYWVNNATHRIASSFERVCKAIGFAECKSTRLNQRRKAADELFKKMRDANHRDRPSLATLWAAANKQKHEFDAPRHSKVAEVNEFIVVDALRTVLELTCEYSDSISRAYSELEQLERGRNRGR